MLVGGWGAGDDVVHIQIVSLVPPLWNCLQRHAQKSVSRLVLHAVTMLIKINHDRSIYTLGLHFPTQNNMCLYSLFLPELPVPQSEIFTLEKGFWVFYQSCNTHFKSEAITCSPQRVLCSQASVLRRITYLVFHGSDAVKAWQNVWQSKLPVPWKQTLQNRRKNYLSVNYNSNQVFLMF